MAFAPLILAGATAILSGVQKQQADRYNAAVMQNEQRMAVNQADVQEGIVRRQSREQIGRQAAAFGGAGVGYGGSSATALDTSAVNQELDALNTRYRGTIAGYGYGTQAQILRQQGNDAVGASVLLAGGQALRSLPSMAGLTTPGGASGLGG